MGENVRNKEMLSAYIPSFLTEGQLFIGLKQREYAPVLLN
jgi:hypothetical protein